MNNQSMQINNANGSFVYHKVDSPKKLRAVTAEIRQSTSACKFKQGL